MYMYVYVCMYMYKLETTESFINFTSRYGKREREWQRSRLSMVEMLSETGQEREEEIAERGRGVEGVQLVSILGRGKGMRVNKRGVNYIDTT